MKAFLFDTETTGLVKNSLIPLPSQPRIIEFFGHTIDDETGAALNELEFFCNPGIALDPQITRITGIKPEDIINAPPFSNFAADILAALAEADAVVAHNLSFDQWLIECELVKSAICLPEGRVPWPARKICTVEQTEWMKGHRLSLSDLHLELFGEPFKGAHRARVDVEALTRCYLELRRRGDL